MIQQTIQFAVANGAAPANFIPSQFNPIPEDGVLEVWACLDPVGSIATAPTLSVTLGGGTPINPIQPTAINVNQFNVDGGPITEANRMMTPQGVQRGTNAQVTITGGSVDVTGYLKVVFRTLAEVAQGLGAAA